MVLAQEESARTSAEKQVCNFIQLLAMLLVKHKVKPNQYSIGQLYICSEGFESTSSGVST